MTHTRTNSSSEVSQKIDWKQTEGQTDRQTDGQTDAADCFIFPANAIGKRKNDAKNQQRYAVNHFQMPVLFILLFVNMSFVYLAVYVFICIAQWIRLYEESIFPKFDARQGSYFVMHVVTRRIFRRLSSYSC